MPPMPEIGLPGALAAVSEGPRGPQVGAFFDYDGTLVYGFSGTPFIHDFILSLRMNALQMVQAGLIGLQGKTTENEFRWFLSTILRQWQGHPESDVEEKAQQIFERRIAARIYPAVPALLAAHVEAGHTVVVATSGSRYQSWPAVRHLGVQHLLCTRFEVVEGVLTGNVAGPRLWGPEKAAAVTEFAAGHDIDLAESYAYSNGGEDAAMLEKVGYPMAVNPDDRLEPEAQRRGWPILRLSREAEPDRPGRFTRLAR